MRQLTFFLASAEDPRSGTASKHVPLVIFVQELVQLLRGRHDQIHGRAPLLEMYVIEKFKEDQERIQAILQAFRMRTLIVIIDGVDEAAGLSTVIEDYAIQELCQSGCRLIMTSRPEGVREELYADRFVVMTLKELNQEQINHVLNQQTSANTEFFDNLERFNEALSEMDRIYEENAPSGKSKRSQLSRRP